MIGNRYSALALAAVFLACPLVAEAFGPPPDQKDVQVRDALNDLSFLVGSWGGITAIWPADRTSPKRSFELNVDDRYGAFYLQDSDGRDNIWVLGYDIAQHRYVLFSPKAGGVELVDVTVQPGKEVVFVTHPDGPAIRTTITAHGSNLHLQKALLDVDGVVKPEVEADLERQPAKVLNFVTH